MKNRFHFTLLTCSLVLVTAFFLDLNHRSASELARSQIQDKNNKIAINTSLQSCSTSAQGETCDEELTPGCTVVTISKGDH